MRRTILSATALACTAVLASTVPAFADGTPPSQTPRPATTAPAPAPTPEPARTPAQDAGPAEVPARDQVSVVPSGAPDTGVALVSTRSGSDTGLIGGGAAAVLVAGGAAVFVLRRRRTTGA
ncbi:sortase-dependent protein [Streptomyces sp. NPDC102274]|uniref:sortase-dependent protein n=1 Tax=Streptomyces sp. NPDC102274 TaxID=3366151 RepID=UPI00380FE9A9